MAVVGVDGCRGGWFAVRIEDGEEGIWDFDVFPTVTDLVETWNDASLILIDIPIGLSSSKKPRACDEEARKRLGSPRNSSVFSPPGRAALNEYRRVYKSISKERVYELVSAANKRQTGKGLSQQAFGIVPKMAEVDAFCVKRVNNHPIIREVHPEICLWALNGKRAMEYNKKKKAGLEERLGVLSKHYRDARDIYNAALNEFLRKEVARDDIVDAMAAAVTACCPDNLRTLPAVPERDDKGLPMEMVYCAVG